VSYSQQRNIVTVAYTDLPNTFRPIQVLQQGFVLSGLSSGSVTVKAPTNVSNYTLVMPSSAGRTGFYICTGSVLGTLVPIAYCPASGSGAPLISITPSDLFYGFVTALSSSKNTFLITNTGNQTLNFSGSAFTFSGTNSADFSVAPTSTCVNSGSLD